jgi:hypothetical protein
MPVPHDLGSYKCDKCSMYHNGKNPARGRAW